MAVIVSLDRRNRARGRLDGGRRRHPRLSVPVEAWWESEGHDLWVSRVDLSLRGAFLPCRAGDGVGARGVLRIALPGQDRMLRCSAEVVRVDRGEHPGMGLRFTQLADADRLLLASHLLRTGGLAVFPQLDGHFPGWLRMAHPGLRGEQRRRVRAEP